MRRLLLDIIDFIAIGVGVAVTLALAEWLRKGW